MDIDRSAPAMLDRVQIRRAETRDTEVLISFNAALAWETEGRRLDHARLRAGILEILEAPHYGFYLIAEAQDPSRAVVGQLLVTYEWSDWRNGTFWWMQSVYVHPPWRRRGVFRRLHQAVRHQAKGDCTVCGLRLYVEQHNHVAQRVYESLGLEHAPYQVYEEDFVLPAHCADPKCDGHPSSRSDDHPEE